MLREMWRTCNFVKLLRTQIFKLRADLVECRLVQTRLGNQDYQDKQRIKVLVEETSQLEKKLESEIARNLSLASANVELDRIEKETTHRKIQVVIENDIRKSKIASLNKQLDNIMGQADSSHDWSFE